jgi:GH25 family lysozyme M1 (1,4-beta-N-acetylmuramidase)
MTIGVDVFSGNGGINWALAKKLGNVEFAIVRAMEGVVPDSRYNFYIAQAEVAGIACSPYLFIHFGHGAAAPEDQAHAFVECIGPCNRYRPVPAIDVEFPLGRTVTGLSAGEAYDWIVRIVTVIKAALGVVPMIYTSRVVWQDPDGLNGAVAPELVECPQWSKLWPFPPNSPSLYNPMMVAGLPDPQVGDPWNGQWIFHQYQGDGRNMPGFTGALDLNRTRDLKLGDRNSTVAWCQRRAGDLVADGYFGPETEERIQKIQALYGLYPDGIVGYFTMSLLSWMNP